MGRKNVPDKTKNKIIEMYYAKEQGEYLYTLKEIEKKTKKSTSLTAVSLGTIMNYVNEYAEKNGLDMRRPKSENNYVKSDYKSINDLGESDIEETLKDYKAKDEQGYWEYTINEICERNEIRRNTLYDIINSTNTPHRASNEEGKLSLKQKFEIITKYKLYFEKEEIDNIINSIKMFENDIDKNFLINNIVNKNIEDEKVKSQMIEKIEKKPIKANLKFEIEK